jgi:hypothetical protein
LFLSSTNRNWRSKFSKHSHRTSYPMAI